MQTEVEITFGELPLVGSSLRSERQLVSIFKEGVDSGEAAIHPLPTI